jgi:glycine oxidase
VELDGETLSAGTVVLCAGSWSSLVEGGGVPAPIVRPARGQMVAIETRPPLFRHVLVAHGRGYLVPRADGVALAGSTLEMVGFRKEVTVAGLHDILALARTLCPELGDAPVVETWSNFRPYTPDQLPVIGRTPVAGLLVATGHHRYGILLTPATAQAIAELVTTGDSSADIAPFSVSRFTKEAR